MWNKNVLFILLVRFVYIKYNFLSYGVCALYAYYRIIAQVFYTLKCLVHCSTVFIIIYSADIKILEHVMIISQKQIIYFHYYQFTMQLKICSTTYMNILLILQWIIVNADGIYQVQIIYFTLYPHETLIYSNIEESFTLYDLSKNYSIFFLLFPINNPVNNIFLKLCI